MSAQYQPTKRINNATQAPAQTDTPKWIKDLFVDPSTGRIFDSLQPTVRLIAENSEELK